MSSLIAWLDYSEDERRHMREVIDLFRESNTLDELGIGSVRDTFSDLVFPGVSTIQTRARYFFFLPWVYLRIEAEKVPSRHAAGRSRRLQTDLIYAMEEGGVTANEGVIGWDARENLQRLPSIVYWGGMGTFDFRRFPGSNGDYHRSLDSFYRQIHDLPKREAGIDRSERAPTNWSPSLPPPPDDLWETTSFALTRTEAEFFREQLARTCPDSLLTHLVMGSLDETEAHFPWDHPDAIDLPDALASILNHAELFSLAIHGAALAYNLMLARSALERGMTVRSYDELESEYEERLSTWADEVDGLWERFQEWNLTHFWQTVVTANPKVPASTRRFVSAWLERVRSDPAGIATLTGDVSDLITQREITLKRSQARLRSHRALERWSGSSGLGRLDYRWGTATTYLSDISAGLSDA